MTKTHWHREMVHNYFRKQLQMRFGSTNGSYMRLLSSTFGMVRDSATGLWLCGSTPSCGTSDDKWRLSYHLICASALECSALLVALEIDAITAFHDFAESEKYPIRPKKKARIAIESLTIEIARSEIVKRACGKYPSKNRELYWFLRLSDPMWLRKKFPCISIDPLPQKIFDRTEIMQILNDNSLSRTLRRNAVPSAPSGLRARVRDKKWLLQQMQQLDSDTLRQTLNLRNNRRATDTALIGNVLSNILNSKEKPQRIHARLLGDIIGRSRFHVCRIIRSNQHLRNRIDEINKNMHHLKNLWAMRESQTQEQSQSFDQRSA